MKHLLLMLVLINPFAQILYLRELIDDMSPGEFIKTHLYASIMSGAIFFLFALSGEFLLENIFQIKLYSLQIFGGMIMLLVAYRYVMSGPGSNNFIRGDITDLAPQISLPYIVGPGTLWVSIQAGSDYGYIKAFAVIIAVLFINFTLIITYQYIVYITRTSGSMRITKYFGILMRTNAFFIGAVAVEMLVTGLRKAFFIVY